MANVLAAFNIKKPVDSEGKVIEPTLSWSSGVTRYESFLHPLDGMLIWEYILVTPTPINV